MSVSKITGVLLIILPIAFNLFFFLLQRTFDYPQILRKPADYILRTFSERRTRLVPLWYSFMFTGLLFILAGVLAPQVIAPDDSLLVILTTTLAVLAGLVQVLGLIRWPFVVPYLAKEYVDPSTTDATRETIAVVFQAIHRYAGVAIGEHLGYLFTALWTLLIGIMLIRSPLFPDWIGWIALIPALGILIGLLEEAGMAVAGTLNAIGYLLWSVWLIIVGLFMLGI